MPLKFNYTNLVDRLDQCRADFDTYRLCLFVNDYTPDETTLIEDVTEATFPGYARQDTDAWQPADLVGGATPTTVEQWHTFVSEGGPPDETVYGYFIVDALGNYVFGERAAGDPISMAVAGTAYLVRPRVTLLNQ